MYLCNPNISVLAQTREIIERLRDLHRLTASEFMTLLQDDDPLDNRFLQSEARRAAVASFGHGIHVRGLLEISSHCRNNCLYCGLRAANASAVRYRLELPEILDCCRKARSAGFRTFVLQGGEDPVQDDDWVERTVSSIHAEFPDCAITLSLGEKSPEAYRRFRLAGADRYLLRHETSSPEHYARLHPAGMSRDRRVECLRVLKSEGYQTGAGMMVGSPYQTLDNLVGDLMFIMDLRPEMIGIGPFIHHSATPFASFPDGSVDMTLKLISVLRLMDPRAMIPATTALSTLDPAGRTKAVLAGANVIMPNITPASVRSDYALYDGIACTGAECADGLEELKKELAAIGYAIASGRGDYDKMES